MQTLTHLRDFLPEHAAISWLPFNPGHVATMNIPKQQTTAMSRGVPLSVMLETQAKMGHAVTAYLHGRPVACFGCVNIWEGVGEMWLLIEERGRKYGKTLTRAAIGYSDFIVISRNLHRLQITVKSSDVSAYNWAKLIGFTPECVMRKYGTDESDFYLMART